MGLPKLFLEVIGVSGSANAMLRGVGRDVTVAAETTGTASKKMNAVAGAALLGVAAAATYVGEKSVRMAADFQQQMTRIQTGAGEYQANMKMVSAGVLAMAGQVGQSTQQLTSALYTVESAGYHGADALTVLRTAAMGAKVGNADLATVADAVTTSLNAYHLGASHAAEVTNALIAAEGQGKTNMEALAGSLATVLPIASAAHVGLNEVLAAMSTMTAEGTPAADAATYLRQTIGQLENPSGKAAQEMKSLGLSTVQVSQNLGKNGLASTLTMLTDAIKSKMGPAGTVLIEHLQKAAKNTTAFQKVLASLPPAQQTYVGALATMVGGTKSMQAALELTGDNMHVFVNNTKIISEHVKAGGKTIEGWALVQKNFNQRLAEAKGTVEALGIRLGNILLPAAQKVLTTTMDLVSWFTRHKTVTKDLGIALAGIAGIMALIKIRQAAIIAQTKVQLAIEKAQVVWQKTAAAATKVWTAAQWLLNVAMDANPIGLIILAIVALAAGIYLLWTHSAAFRNFFIGLWKDIWGFLKGVGAWFAGPFANFFVSAFHWIEALPGKIIGFLEALPGKLVDLWVRGLKLVLFAVGYYIGSVIRFWAELPGRVWSLIKTLFNGAVTLVSWGIHAVLDFWEKLPGRVVAAVTFLWDTATRLFSQGVDAVVRFVSALPGKIGKLFDDTWHWAVRTSTTLVLDVIHWFEQLPGRAVNAVSSLGKSIINALKDAGTWLLDAGKQVIMGLVHGITGAIGAAIDAVKGALGSVISGAKSALGISSPSKVFAEQVGKWIPHGIAQGITDNAAIASRAVAGLAGGLTLPGLAGGGLGGGFTAGGSGTIVIENHVLLDGKDIYQNQVTYSQQGRGRTGSTLLTDRQFGLARR